MPRGRARPERSCAACRRKAGRGELLRLVADAEGRVWVDRRARLPGRGAWVCPRRDCVERLERRPGLLSRAFRRPVRAEGLLEQVRVAALEDVAFGLSLAARSGRLLGGAEALERALPRGGFVALLVAADASPRAEHAAARLAPGLPRFRLPWDRAELGRRVGRGPRAVLALRPGPASRYLLERLRRLEALG